VRAWVSGVMAVVAGGHYVLGVAGVVTLPYEKPLVIVSGGSVVDHVGISRFSREPRFAGWGAPPPRAKGGGAGGGAASETTPLLALPGAPPAKDGKAEGVRKIETDDRARPGRRSARASQTLEPARRAAPTPRSRPRPRLCAPCARLAEARAPLPVCRSLQACTGLTTRATGWRRL